MFRHFSLIVVSLFFLAGFAVPAAQDASNDKDKKALQGKWQIVSVVEGGVEAKGKGKKFASFDGGKIKIISGLKDEEIVDAATFRLDAGKTPKTIDFKGKDGARWAGKSIGIYQLKDDELKLCLAEKTRPTEFASTAKNDQVVIVLKRVKN